MAQIWIVIEDFNRACVPHCWRRPNVVGAYSSEEKAREVSQRSTTYFMSGPLPMSTEKIG